MNDKKKGSNPMENSKPAWGVAGGVLAVSAWVTAYICRGHFELWDFLGAFAGITLLTILVYAGGFVAFALAGGEKDWLERLLYILGGIGANVFLIWKIFF